MRSLAESNMSLVLVVSVEELQSLSEVANRYPLPLIAQGVLTDRRSPPLRYYNTLFLRASALSPQIKTTAIASVTVQMER